MTEKIIQQQKDALVTTIKDLQKREALRLHRLSATHSKAEYRQLAQRYDRERELEKERIDHLRADLMLIHKKNADGSLVIPVEERRERQIETYRVNQGGKFDTAVSRFFGLENINDVLFQGDVTKKFEKHDRRFQASLNRQPYDPIEDIKKYRLLEQKRDILLRLMDIQGAEQPQPQQQRRCAGSSYGGSAYSDSSSRSGSSYATFATSSAAMPVVRRTSNAGPPARPPPVVPRLQLS